MAIYVPITLTVIALFLTLVHGITGKVPLWVAVLLLCIAMLVPGVR
ncbi:MAG TPA: hypothetical protein VFO46_02410 [Candidatus Sulfotelmatobacter sp.]|nr:hypothetical protein [Candidatus Sulfotelmatobacter sp.]